MSVQRAEGQVGMMRSKLFVPASRPALFSKALASKADAVCFDLEDAVLPAHKTEARSNLRAFLASDFHTNKTIMVRVNHVRSAHFAEDLSAAAWPTVSVLTLPKVEDPSEVTDVAEALLPLEKQRKCGSPIAILVTIESPRGLRLAESIAGAHTRVVGLQLGLADLFEPLGIQHEDASGYQVRLKLRLAAGEVGVPCFDSAFSNFKDGAGFIRDATMARSLGFSGKSCIHPGQIAAANRIFSPDSAEITASLRIVEASRVAAMGGAAAFALDGRMVDAPFVSRAEALLQRAENIRLLDKDK